MLTFSVLHMLELCCLTTLKVRFRLFFPQSTSCSAAKQFCTKTLRLRAPNIGLLVGWILDHPRLWTHESKFKPAHGSEPNHYAASTQCNRYKQIRLYLDRLHSSGRSENMSWNLHSGNTKQRPLQRNFKMRCNVLRVTRVRTLIVATIYLQLIQNRYMFRSFTVLHCSHQHCVQPVASDVEVVGYL